MRWPCRTAFVCLALLLGTGCQGLPSSPAPEDPILMAVLKHLETCPTTQDMMHVFAWEEQAFPGAEAALETIGIEVTADRSIFREYRPLVILSAPYLRGLGFRESDAQRIPTLGHVHFEHFEGAEDCPVEVLVQHDGTEWGFPKPNEFESEYEILDEIICTF